MEIAVTAIAGIIIGVVSTHLCYAFVYKKMVEIMGSQERVILDLNAQLKSFRFYTVGSSTGNVVPERRLMPVESPRPADPPTTHVNGSAVPQKTPRSIQPARESIVKKFNEGADAIKAT